MLFNFLKEPFKTILERDLVTHVYEIVCMMNQLLIIINQELWMQTKTFWFALSEFTCTILYRLCLSWQHVSSMNALNDVILSGNVKIFPHFPSFFSLLVHTILSDVLICACLFMFWWFLEERRSFFACFLYWLAKLNTTNSVTNFCF